MRVLRVKGWGWKGKGGFLVRMFRNELANIRQANGEQRNQGL